MLKLDKSSTRLKVTRLQYTLFALTTKRTFRYFLVDFISGILKICFILYWQCTYYSGCYLHDRRLLLAVLS
jgi:hypothetical protein